MRAAVLVLLAAPTLASDAANYAGNLLKLIDIGWSKAGHRQWLHNDVREALSRSPKHAAEVAAAAVKRVRADTIAEDKWTDLVAFLMKTTERCLTLAPKDANAMRAAADSHLTRARLAVRLGQKPKAADWTNAVSLLLRVHKIRPAKGAVLSEVVRVLLDEHRDEKLLEKTCAIGGANYPKKGIFRIPKMRARLDAAKEEEALAALLDDWKPLAETYDDDMLALYNEAVTIAKRRKVKTKHDWLLYTGRRFTAGLKLNFPWYRWVGYDDLTQYERDGTLRATITFTRESGELTTKTAKATAAQLQREIGGKFTLKPGKRKLNKHFKRCFSFAMGGLDKQGDFVHCRVFLLRVASGRSSITRVEVWTRTAEPDPEIELILATLRPYSVKPGR